MAKYKWHTGKVPKYMEIKQEYGIVFSKDGRILLKIEKDENKNKYSLAGGTTEIHLDIKDI